MSENDLNIDQPITDPDLNTTEPVTQLDVIDQLVDGQKKDENMKVIYS